MQYGIVAKTYFFSNKKEKLTNIIHCEHDFYVVFPQFLVRRTISPLLFNVTVKWVTTIKYYFFGVYNVYTLIYSRDCRRFGVNDLTLEYDT